MSDLRASALAAHDAATARASEESEANAARAASAQADYRAFLLERFAHSLRDTLGLALPDGVLFARTGQTTSHAGYPVSMELPYAEVDGVPFALTRLAGGYTVGVPVADDTGRVYVNAVRSLDTLGKILRDADEGQHAVVSLADCTYAGYGAWHVRATAPGEGAEEQP